MSDPRSGGYIFLNARIYVGTNDGKFPKFAECLILRNGLIQYVGSAEENVVARAKEDGAQLLDLKNKFILPGFIDGHVHLLHFGTAMHKLDLTGCETLQHIRQRIQQYAKSHAELKRILCTSWMVSMTGKHPTKEMLEGIEGLDGRPVYVDEKSLHSTWCNEVALKELGVAEMQDPVGGEIHRDDAGTPTGLLSEGAAFSIVWPYLAGAATMDEKLLAINSAVDVYLRAGYTGIIEMAMDENGWEALLELRKKQQIPMRVAAHWLITPSATVEGCLAQVDRAIKLHQSYNRETSPDLRIAGIKVICDGIIDSCTAALLEPYSPNGFSSEPLWQPDMLAAVVRKADRAGLQCALHAIGDKTVLMAIDALEQNGTPGRRHRIEHLELTSLRDAQRLGQLGITASIQPVHSDPAILRAWPQLLGGDRLARAFAYKNFLESGANLSIGTDSPTSPHHPFPNFYTASTRRSAREPQLLTTVNEHFALSLCQTISAATQGSAYSCFAESYTGSLQPGLSADFIVVDMEWDAAKLLQAKVVQTWFAGERVFDQATAESDSLNGIAAGHE